jgi:hypothetical protein
MTASPTHEGWTTRILAGLADTVGSILPLRRK